MSLQDALLALPELPTILTYHVLPGKYLTNDMYNNTPIYTCLGAVQVGDMLAVLVVVYIVEAGDAVPGKLGS
jgi:hypothetical protein